ncbi:MAG TPA: glycosyltransferase family 4 protein [Anaerolineales bacterium]|nr:glycosyltransferase family 4 protein [Anaerolineales bacterium]
MSAEVQGRVGLQQRVLPGYRATFIDRLAARCPDGLSVFAGDPRPEEVVVPAPGLETAQWHRGRNLHLFGGALFLCLQPGLIRWLEDWNPRLLILEANPRYISNWDAAAWMRARGRPVLGWGLGVPARSGLGRFAWRRFLKRLNGTIAYSQRGAREYTAAGVRADRVWVAPNAVTDSAEAAPDRRTPSEGAPRLIFVGRLQRRKRLDVLLAAASGLRPAAEVWIVGDGPARRELEAEAADRGVSARFHGDVRGAQLDRLLDQADVFVLPGTGGLAVQQAMARGLPVIVAEGDGTQEDLVTTENGWLVPSGDVEALRQKLQTALSRRDRLLDMGRASRRLVVQRFNVDAMADVFVTALRTAAEDV